MDMCMRAVNKGPFIFETLLTVLQARLNPLNDSNLFETFPPYTELAQAQPDTSTPSGYVHSLTWTNTIAFLQISIFRSSRP